MTVRAENEMTLVRVDDGQDGEISEEQITQITQSATQSATQATQTYITEQGFATETYANTQAAAAAEGVTEDLTPLINAKEDTTAVDEKMAQLSDATDEQISEAQVELEATRKELDAKIEQIKTYINLVDTVVTVGESNSPLKVEISNTDVAFTDTGKKVAWVNGKQLYITSADLLNDLRLGNFQFKPRRTGSLSIVYAPKGGN